MDTTCYPVLDITGVLSPFIVDNRCYSILDISCVVDALCIVGDILLLVGTVEHEVR